MEHRDHMNRQTNTAAILRLIHCIATIGVSVMAWFIVMAACSSTALGQKSSSKLMLDNGLARITFDTNKGTFDARGLSEPTIVLRDAAPECEVDGKVLSVNDLVNVTAHKEQFNDSIGQGEKIAAIYSFKDGIPSIRYEIRLYAGQPAASIQAFLPAGTYHLGNVNVIHGSLAVREAFNTRVYLNSGEAGGRTGVWDLGIQRWQSAVLSSWYDVDTKDALAISFYSFQRAGTTVQSQYLGPQKIGVTAQVHYNGYKVEGKELPTESALLTFGRNPVQMLDDWARIAASVVHPKFNHDTHTGYIDVWYTFGDKASDEQVLEQAKLLRKSVLPGYGMSFVSLGEWQKQRHEFGDGGDDLGFGEDLIDEKLFPRGLEPLCKEYHQMGFGCTFGANYAYAAPESSIAKKNVPWLVKEDRSRLSFGAPIDFTNPAAQDWVYDLFHRAEPIGAKWVWTDFDGGPTRGTLNDPTKIRGFEDIREGLSAIRRAVGDDTFIQKFCCGPYFTYLGLADRVRVGRDMVALGDFDGLEAVARQLAGNYMLHQRFWINDPDPLFVGGREYVHNYGSGSLGSDPAIRDEVRMRLQLEVSAGGFVTLGEDMHDLGPNEIRMLTQVLPTYGQAATPLDMFTHSIPEVYDLKVATSWDKWNVLMLQNWEASDKTYDIHFDWLKLDPLKNYLVFRFWDQKLLGTYSGAAKLTVSTHTGETYAIREVPSHPWVLSTDMHLTQGGVELTNVTYKEETGILSGTATRHPGANGSIVAYLPRGYELLNASYPYLKEQQSDGSTLIRLTVAFNSTKAEWSLKCQRAKE
jgi:hypothetical protein